MTIDYSAQHLLFLWSVAAGAALSLFYDLFRLIRALGFKDKFSVFLQDVVFCLVSALIYILLLFNFSSGVLRLYALIGMAAGFLLCHLTLGALFMKCVNGIKKAVFSLLRRIKAVAVRLCVRYRSRSEKKRAARAERREAEQKLRESRRQEQKLRKSDERRQHEADGQGKNKNTAAGSIKHREEKGKTNDKKNKRKRNG